MKINEINEDYDIQLLNVKDCCKLRSELPADTNKKTKNKKIKRKILGRQGVRFLL